MNITIGDYFPINLVNPPFNLVKFVRVYQENANDPLPKNLILYDFPNFLSLVNFEELKAEIHRWNLGCFDCFSFLLYRIGFFNLKNQDVRMLFFYFWIEFFWDCQILFWKNKCFQHYFFILIEGWSNSSFWEYEVAKESFQSNT